MTAQPFHRIGITQSDDVPIAQHCFITLDGEPLKGVRAVTVDLKANPINQVVLVMDALLDVDILAELSADGVG